MHYKLKAKIPFFDDYFTSETFELIKHVDKETSNTLGIMTYYMDLDGSIEYVREKCEEQEVKLKFGIAHTEMPMCYQC